MIDVDDVRQLVVSGAVAPWQGPEGRRQQHLGVENACSLARRFLDHAIEVVIADVVNPDTLTVYRRLLPDAVVIHLQVSLVDARRRAAMRNVCLTNEQFEALHGEDREHPPSSDHQINVTGLTLEQQLDTVARLWHRLP